MGWRLAVEVLDRCPDVSYREFRVLIALALDARDETRQGMPGHELLARRGHCGIRTVRRALAELERRGIIACVARPAPDRRAVYAILSAGATADSIVTGVTAAIHESTAVKSAPNGGHDVDRPLVNVPSHRPKSSSVREAKPRPALVPDPAGDEMMIMEIFKSYRPAEAQELTAEDAGRLLDELQRRSREPITNLRSFARACISRDPDHWLQVASGELPDNRTEMERASDYWTEQSRQALQDRIARGEWTPHGRHETRP